MKQKTRWIALILAAGLMLTAPACGQNEPGAPSAAGSQQIEEAASGTSTIERTIQIHFSSTSDWSNLVIRNAEIIQGYEVLESWGEFTRKDVSENGITINQESAHSENGIEIGVLAEYTVLSPQTPGEIVFVLEKGDLNTTRVVISDVTDQKSFILEEVEHNATDLPNDFNRIRFSIVIDGQAPEKIQAASGSDGVGGIIFHNGVILTMDTGNPAAEAVFVKDGLISAIGSRDEVLQLAGADTTVIDLEGRTMMPGFVDGHTHSFNNIWRDDFEGGQQVLLSRGITTSAEMFVEEPLIQDMQAFDQDGKLRMRISLYPVHVDNCGDNRGDWYWPKYPVSREDGAMLQIPGIKFFSDGGSCNQPAKSFKYEDGGYGDLYMDANELADLIIEAQNRGYQVAIHGLGDRAIEVNLDAIKIAMDGGPNIYRHRSEHNTLVRDDMLSRYSEIDVVSMIFGSFPACRFNSGFYSESPDAYQHWEWRWRSLLDENPDVHFAWHSDSPGMGQPKPFKHIYSFLTRREIQDDGTICEPPDWAADDLLTVEEVLPLMTIESAYALLRDHEIGSLKAGKLADMIILSENPLQVDTESIRDIQVLMTMVGGEVVHCLPGYTDLCP